MTNQLFYAICVPLRGGGDFGQQGGGKTQRFATAQDLISGILGSSKNSIDKVIAMSGVVRRCVVISSHVTRALVELKIARIWLQ